MEFFLCVLGTAMFIEGLPWAAFPKQFRKYLVQLIGMPSSYMRVMGFALMTAGLIMFYCGKH